MYRGVRRCLLWRRGLWLREAPGRRGLAVFLFAPLAFFLPLEAAGIVGSRVQAISVVIWLLAITLPLSVRSGSTPRDASAIWFFQKGFGLKEAALQDWLLDLLFFSAAACWWAATGAAVLALSQPITILNVLALWGLGLSVALLTHAVSFSLSSWGAQRSTDPVAFLAFISVLLPPLTMNAPGWVFGIVDWVVPSYHSTMLLSGALRGGQAREAADALFHILLYSGIVLWLGLLRIARWRPTG